MLEEETKIKVERMLREFRNEVFNGEREDLLFDDDQFLQWLEDNWFNIEDNEK